jgi:hypothetical protein
MAKRRKAERKRKAGPREPNGRLSRAYKHPDVRDHGTPEVQSKRQVLVGEGNDPTRGATVIDLLFATGHIDLDQHTEGFEYRRLHAAVYGHPWGNAAGGEPTDEALVALKEKLEKRERRIGDQRKLNALIAVANDQQPQWWHSQRVGLPLLPEDIIEHMLLMAALNAMVGMTSLRKAA